MARQTIASLPISSSAPIFHLVPDPLFPTPHSLLALSTYVPPEDLAGAGPVALKAGDPVPPSMSRRSRMVRGGGTFSYTSPLPLEFPYDIQEQGEAVDKRVGDEVKARPTTIESRLADLEPSPQFPVFDPSQQAADRSTAFSSSLRQSTIFPTPNLLSFSRRCADAWLPNLEVGDAATLNAQGPGTPEQVAIREKLVDVLAGRTVLAREPVEGATDRVEKLGFAPWALCYGGHQFGQWAGQLGDGRAISILSTPATEQVKLDTGFHTLELQLKGAGRTPYSRFADGLAVLRSSVREYLGAEAMAALGLPTSRALALVGIPGVKVRRERIETAAIVTRVASSWIRIGNFEIQATRKEWEALRKLSSYVGTEVFKFDDATCPPLDSKKGRGMALSVLREVSNRNAIMIAGWQAYGFMHGVMNTDNIAVTGACIDYGPYAFMDVFDPHHICNHSDDEGRYSFRNQPTMGVFAVQKLGDALAELIGCEEDIAKAEEGSSRIGYVQADEAWGEGGEATGCMEGWRAKGLEKVEEVKSEFVEVFTAEYTRLMRLRLGLSTSQDGDFDLTSALLDLLALHELDYSSTLRLLSQFPGTASPLLPRFLDLLLPTKQVASDFQIPARVGWTTWLRKYEARLEDEKSSSEGRRARQDAVNPRFVLRQWVLEETIAKLDADTADVKALDRVLEMVSEPFGSYGEEELEGGDAVCAVEVEREKQRLCGIGSEKMLGFQCSCSS